MSVFPYPSTEIKCGIKTLKVFELSPASIVSISMANTIKILENIVASNAAVILKDDLIEYAAEEDDIERINNLRNSVHFLGSIAYSIPGSNVFKLSNEKMQHLFMSNEELLVICPRSVGSKIRSLCGNVRNEIYIDSYTQEDFALYQNLWKEWNLRSWRDVFFDLGDDIKEIQTCLYMQKLGRAIGDLHSQNIIHGDLNPSNVGIFGESELKFFDSGSFRYLLREPTPIECASDFIQMFPYFTQRYWRQFVLSYLFTYKNKGNKVIELIHSSVI